MKRQLSKPRVMTIFFPRAPRNCLGKLTRFFSSSVCSYSPINIVVAFSHFFPLSYIIVPLYTTTRQLSTLRLAALAQCKHCQTRHRLTCLPSRSFSEGGGEAGRCTA